VNENKLFGVVHHYTDEQLMAYRRLTPEQRLEWLHAIWQFTVDFLPREKLQIYQAFRAGKL